MRTFIISLLYLSFIIYIYSYIDGFQCLHFNADSSCLADKKMRALGGEIATKGRKNGELEGIRL